MATKPLTRISKKQETATASSLSIEAQTKAFLEAGGKVEQVKTGVSGQPSMAPPKPFAIGKKQDT